IPRCTITFHYGGTISVLRRGGVFYRFARTVPELLGLFGQCLHLFLDVLRLQLQDLVDIPGTHHLLSEFQRLRDILLGEGHRGLTDVAGTLARGFGLSFERGHGAARGRYKALKRLPRLLKTLLRKRPHLWWNFETVALIPGHAHLPPLALLL